MMTKYYEIGRNIGQNWREKKPLAKEPAELVLKRKCSLDLMKVRYKIEISICKLKLAEGL